VTALQGLRGRSPVLPTLAALLVFGACVVKAPAVVALVVPLAAGVPLLLLLVRGLHTTKTGESDEYVLRWTMGALVLHLVIALAVSYSLAATTYLGGDAIQYHQGATQLANAWSGHGAMPVLPAGKEGFFYLLGALYYVFGAHIAAGAAINAVIASALVPVLTDTTRRLFGTEAARFAPPLALLLPGLLLWTSQVLREASVLLLLAVAVNLALRLSERASARALVTLAVTIALLFTFRANVAYVLLGGLAVGLIISKRHVAVGLSLGAGILSMSLLLVASAGLGYSGYRAAADANLNQVNAIRLDSSVSAASGFSQGGNVSTPGGALAYLPSGLAQFMLGPFPWQIHSSRQVPALVDVVVLWALVPSLWRGLARARRTHRRAAAVLLVPAAITACMLALLTANFGTVVRERMQVIVLILPFVCAGLAVRASERAAASAPHVPAAAR
jgi:hypothetical protein